MSTYLLSIAGLTVTAPWEVGPVRIFDATFARELLRRSTDSLVEPGRSIFSDTADAIQRGAVAQVIADDLDAAHNLVATAVDLLLVFKETAATRDRTTTFGMPGDVAHVVEHYLKLDKPGAGFRHAGHHVGWTFSDDEAARWRASGHFQAIAASIGDPTPGDGQQRALVGVQFFAQAIRELRPTLKLVSLVSGLEAMLLPRRSQAQTYRLARHVAYFGCGLHADDLCGRGRPTCELLATQPTNKTLTRLRQLEAAARSGPPWRCSEWLRVIDWYDTRSEILHGGTGHDLTAKNAGAAEYWILHQLTAPILTWLTTHPDDPISDLENALADLPTPAETVPLPSPPV